MVSFKEWIKRYEGEDSPFGDLAEDIRTDPKFPSGNDKDNILSYLKHKNACREAISSFRKAYKAMTGEDR